MAIKYTDEFRRDAVRLSTTSDLTRPQIASDLGVGVSTLNKWLQKHQHEDLMSGPHDDVEKENARLRKEVHLLCRPKPMGFSFIDAWREVWSVEFLCRVMQVTSRGFRAWKVRPMSQRQRDDMVILAHIREQHHLCLQSYSHPRMTEELQELGGMSDTTGLDA